MRQRDDGSFQSANTPTWVNVGLKEDYAMYRCMVTKIFFVDDSQNITKNAQNPEVIYQVVILGGAKSGQLLTNVRLSSDLGGDSTFSERTLKASTKSLDKVKLQDHDGDIVYVQFTQAHQGYPVIVAMGKGIHDAKSGTKKLDAPRSINSYNGVIEEINNQGELKITRSGGTLSTKDQTFAPSSSFESKISLLQNEVVTIETKSGPTVKIDGKNSSISIKAGSTEVLIDGKSGKISLKGGLVDLGASVSDFVTKFTEMASAFASHTHPFMYSAGPSPATGTSMPPSAPMPASVGSQTVKVQS